MFPVESEVTQSSLSLTIKSTDFHTDRTFVVSVLAEITRDLMLFVAYFRVRAFLFLFRNNQTTKMGTS